MASWESGCLMGRVRFGFLLLVQSVSAMRAVDGRSSSYVFNVSEGNRPQLTASSSAYLEPVVAMQESQYNKKSSLKLLDRLFLPFIVVVVCVIVFVSPFWLQVSLRFFISTISRVITYMSTPKVLFLLTNIIVITLIGESMFSRSRSVLSTSELRKECITVRNNSCDLWSCANMKMGIGCQQLTKENMDRPRHEDGKRRKLSPMQMDSLHQRADDLIARVNRRRRLETGILHSHIDHSRMS
ncbi:hypothetical protein Bca4012_049322 [Brassica carinata]